MAGEHGKVTLCARIDSKSLLKLLKNERVGKWPDAASSEVSQLSEPEVAAACKSVFWALDDWLQTLIRPRTRLPNAIKSKRTCLPLRYQTHPWRHSPVITTGWGALRPANFNRQQTWGRSMNSAEMPVGICSFSQFPRGPYPVWCVRVIKGLWLILVLMIRVRVDVRVMVTVGKLLRSD